MPRAYGEQKIHAENKFTNMLIQVKQHTVTVPNVNQNLLCLKLQENIFSWTNAASQLSEHDRSNRWRLH